MIMKRSKDEITEGILELCQEPASLTRIVYQCNLNFRTVKPHLARLTLSGCLLELPGGPINLYQTSPKGMEALQHIKALRDLLKPLK